MAQLTEEVQGVALKALASALGKEVSDIETILTGDNPGEVDSLVTSRVKAIRDEGNKAGRGTLQKAANKKAKELYNVDSSAETMDDLLTAIKDSYVPVVDPATLTEEQVKTHPTFKAVEKQLRDKDSEHSQALQKAKEEAEARITTERLTAKAIKALTDYGAVLSEDPKLAKVQERMYLEGLTGVTTKEVDGVTEFWKDGKRLENDKLFPVSEVDFFKGMVEGTYTTNVSPQRQSPGVPADKGGAPATPGSFVHFKGTPPKTEAEYNAILRDRVTNNFDAREEVAAYWKAQQTPK